MKNIIKYIFKNKMLMGLFIMVAAVSLVTGCGSGMNTGRYVAPSELGGNDDFSDGTGGGGSSGGGGSVPGQTDVEALISSAWSDFNYGAYSSAINKFNEATLDPNITSGQMAEANNGLGWSLAKANGISAGQSFFLAAAEMNDEARLGLSTAYVQAGDYENAKNYLEQLGLSNVAFTLSTVHNVGVSSAEAHAMLALSYYMTGDRQGAIDQMKSATAADLSSDSSVKQIRSTLLALDPSLANFI